MIGLNDPISREEAHDLLTNAYDLIDRVVEGLGLSSLSAYNTWSKILTKEEIQTVRNDLYSLREIMAGVLEDIEKNRPLPYTEGASE